MPALLFFNLGFAPLLQNRMKISDFGHQGSHLRVAFRIENEFVLSTRVARQSCWLLLSIRYLRAFMEGGALCYRTLKILKARNFDIWAWPSNPLTKTFFQFLHFFQ